MRHFPKLRKTLMLSFGIIGMSMTAQTDRAHAYDMDCKVILCIAGGFPSGCSDAYSYMIKRITNKPKPKPPFGFCAMSDGAEYKAHNVDYRFLGNTAEGYDCPEGKQVYFRHVDDGARGQIRNGTAFCATHTSQERTGGRDGEDITIYHNQSAAQRVNFQLKITIEPGTEHEYRSPVFRVNTSTGYVSQRQF